jgi:hypothetical protein
LYTVFSTDRNLIKSIRPVKELSQEKFPSILFMLHATGGHAGAICMRLAATQLHCMRLAATQLQFACDWRPLGYNLVAASRIQFLHALSASCVQSHQFFASTLREQLFELINEDAI